VAWLEGSPFGDYTVPSVCLLGLVGGLVGGLAVAAAVVVARRRPEGRPLAALAGGVLVAWIVVQVGVIGPVSWLQPAMLVAGLALVALASRLDDRRIS
jgi:peptidoglycan/LPS O-acetylase OafA/YrhL